MAYEMVKYEWDLTKEEQEQAQFIVEWCHKTGQKLSAGHAIDSNEGGGFIGFKQAFYESVRLRLGIPIYTSGFGSFNVTDDYKKLVAYKVEKKGD